MFRVGDVVEREGLGGSTQHIVKSINPAETHISIDDTEYRYLAVYYKLIKPVWLPGDTAKVTKHGPNFGHEFTVQAVASDSLLDVVKNGFINWRRTENCERIALAPKPLQTAGIEINEMPNGTTKVTFKAGDIHVLPGQPSDFKTTLAREMEIPTYLYNVVEVKPTIKGGSVVMDSLWTVHVDFHTDPQRLELRNIDGPIFNAERLRQLAKLCTDLADLMR